MNSPNEHTQEPGDEGGKASVTQGTVAMVYANAIALPDAEHRTAYLDQICENNPLLRQKVDEKIAAYEVAFLLREGGRIPDDAFESESEEEENAENELVEITAVPTVTTNPVQQEPLQYPSGMAFMPMGTEQMQQIAAMNNGGQSRTLPWLVAVIFAALAGAAAVLFYFERDARLKAEQSNRQFQAGNNQPVSGNQQSVTPAAGKSTAEIRKLQDEREEK